MDKTSKAAFEITKNVTESNAETLVNVRSGGLVGELRKEIEQFQAEFIRLNIIIDNRAEDLEIKAKYEQLQAENKQLKQDLSDSEDNAHELQSCYDEMLPLCKQAKQLQAENKHKDKALDIVFKRLDTGSHSYHKHYHGGCILCEIVQALNTTDGKDK